MIENTPTRAVPAPAAEAGPPLPRTAAGVLRGCVRLLRGRQWIKNGFVFAALIFGARLQDAASVRQAVWTFLSFCLVASAVYTVNDWFDRNEDRRHPVKRMRPLASGVVPGAAAAGLAACLLLAAAGILLAAGNAAVAALEAAYFVINVFYSFALKRVVLLDAFVIAAGFVMRVLAGAFAVDVAASHWLLLCMFLLALFLGFAKRRSELEVLKEIGSHHRPVLGEYSAALLIQLNVILCSATVVCYALYTVSPETVARLGTDHLIYTVPFVLYGLFRYLYLVEITREGDNPSALLLRDRPLLASVALWLAVCVLVIYGPAAKL
jgi:4-hydroxybenzoate polyprenyltransferase